jgi:argininosuccinate lyase
MEDAV